MQNQNLEILSFSAQNWQTSNDIECTHLLTFSDLRWKRGSLCTYVLIVQQSVVINPENCEQKKGRRKVSKPFWNVFCHEAPAQWSSAHQHSHCGLRRRWLKSVFRDKANAPLHVNVLIRSTLDVHPKKRKGGLWKGRHWKEWLPGPILCTLLSWSELWRWTLNTAPDQIHLSKSIVHQMHLCSRMNAIRCLLDLVQWSSHFNFQRGFRLQTKGFFNQWSPHHCHGHRIIGLSWYGEGSAIGKLLDRQTILIAVVCEETVTMATGALPIITWYQSFLQKRGHIKYLQHSTYFEPSSRTAIYLHCV